MIKINMDKAREIWREKIAKDRATAFEKNDIVIRDAQINNDQTTLELALKRRDDLRAIGDRIKAARTPEELKSILP